MKTTKQFKLSAVTREACDEAVRGRRGAVLASGEARSIEALAEREALSAVHLGKLIPLAFLAPDLATNILAARQPARLTLSALIGEPLPLAWDDQRVWAAKFA